MNDLLCYKKEEEKILYKVSGHEGDKLILTGINYRKKIMVDMESVVSAPEELIRSENFINKNYQRLTNDFKKKKGYILGTVLHFDADEMYLEKIKQFYNDIGIYSYTILCSEKNLNEKIDSLDIEFIPDVIVITGHDYYNGNNKQDINSYKNSCYYAKAIYKIKTIYPNSVVIGGACQSNFELLMAKGANFASSPGRINIHIYDPAILAVMTCTTSNKQLVNFEKTEKYIKNFREAFGGVETNGKMKMLY